MYSRHSQQYFKLFLKDLNHLAFSIFFKVPSLLFYKEEKTNEDF